MKSVALGIRMHSGWGVLVAVTGSTEIVERRRIDIIGDEMNAKRRGNQPYHFAEELGLPKAEKYLADYTAETNRRAREALGAAVRDLNNRGFSIATAALVLASGRPLPPLPQILAAHPLIHTAEGELFRETMRHACEGLGIPIKGYRERDLKHAASRLSSKTAQKIAAAGKLLGPPWTPDHKSAALAACLALTETGVEHEGRKGNARGRADKG